MTVRKEEPELDSQGNPSPVHNPAKEQSPSMCLKQHIAKQSVMDEMPLAEQEGGVCEPRQWILY